ncbi:MAG: DUF5711 family protein [Blautia sp.]|nr:DUF5711 family protein [Blautia sp.]MDY5032326.1 DUF5711 family protein [Blautia sp.]
MADNKKNTKTNQKTPVTGKQGAKGKAPASKSKNQGASGKAQTNKMPAPSVKEQPKARTQKKAPPAPLNYEDKLSRHRRAVFRRTIIAVGAVLAAVVLILLLMEKRSYHNYRVLQTSDQEDVISTKYVEMDGKIFRYSPDGASLVTKQLETVWSESFSMQNPVAHVNGTRAVVADRDGTSMEMFDKNGYTGSVTTSYTIVKAKVSKSGLVAAILDNGEDTWINFYSYDGSLIAENQTRIDDPGYPMDVAISDDGTVMMVTYQFVDGGDTTSYVAFYNFGDVGQNEDDRIVSGYTYEGVVIPQIEYLGSSQSLALRDDGFTIYKGKQIPKEGKTVKIEQEIVSTFFDEDHIGLVFKNDGKEKLYTMKVYNTSGSLLFEKDFNIPYTSIRMCDDMILMYNSSQICVLNNRGVEKYLGTVDGTVNDFFKIGWNRYLLVLDNGVNVIKLT